MVGARDRARRATSSASRACRSTATPTANISTSRKFDPILRACADTGQPLYIHPQTPPDAMIGPMLEAGLDGAIFGFGVETGCTCCA